MHIYNSSLEVEGIKSIRIPVGHRSIAPVNFICRASNGLFACDPVLRIKFVNVNIAVVFRVIGFAILVVPNLENEALHAQRIHLHAAATTIESNGFKKRAVPKNMA